LTASLDCKQPIYQPVCTLFVLFISNIACSPGMIVVVQFSAVGY